MSAGISITLDATHKLAEADQIDDPTGFFHGLKVVYKGGHTDTWGDIESPGQWWFEISAPSELINPVAVDIAFKEKDDADGAWTQGDDGIIKMSRPDPSAGDVNWNRAPAAVTWGINAHGGGTYKSYDYILKVEYGPANDRKAILLDPEIHNMKA